MYDDVLLPTDGSDGTRRAITHGLELADRYGATVHALSVVTEGPYRSLEGERATEAAERNAERAVERVVAEAERKRLPVATAIRRGAPGDEILAYADEAGIDAIVMGTHARTGLDRFLVGSVTERIVRAADAPVVTVRMDEELRIEDGDRAATIALDALAEEGYADASVAEEPHRTSASWIVPADTADGRVHVHVDALDGDARVASIDR